MIDLFNLHRVDVGSYNRHWLQNKRVFPHQDSSGYPVIGFFTAASIPAKRWPVSSWIELGEMILERHNHKIIVYAGTSQDEMELAREIVEYFHSRYPQALCSLQKDLSLPQLISSLGTLDLLLSNDSVSIHLATALNIPIIGLYFCTNGIVWGGQGKNFSLIQSDAYLHCTEVKEPFGNCKLYYSGCHLSCINACYSDVTPTKVYNLVQYKLIHKG